MCWLIVWISQAAAWYPAISNQNFETRLKILQPIAIRILLLKNVVPHMLWYLFRS